ncbi:MAG: helix-turn-helix transcriptional regulator [Anaerolineaceae bacterium]|nr:MAG: helix-turn-helix transcriptional regulator [Anaerolineaceae bacterium]
MSDPLLATKISLPILRQILVPRRKVLEQLNDGLRDGHLLTLVSAPAGYGKTTTIRMWVEQAGCPVAWVTLEKSDNDLKQFLAYLFTALGRAVSDLGQSALEMVENAQEINPTAALGLLVNDLHGLDQPIILVLEEYHLIENEMIDQAVEYLLTQSIASLRLVIATREDPSLPLTRLRVRNQLTEIRAADLSFSLEEAVEFFADVMGVNLSKKETEILKDKTEGWAAGLQLAALSLKENKDTAKFVEAFGGTHRHVLDYLIEETLNSQAEEMREFLRRTSVLDQLSAPLCEAVTERRESKKILQYLESNNLFLVSLDEERNWYRYHALFGELLKNQLLQVEPERASELHERAADWYEKNGFIQKAVEHAFQISDGGKVSRLIERHALPMIYQGEVSTVAGWFDRLPEPLIQVSPMLCVCKAWSLVLMQRKTMRIREAEQALQAAGDALDHVNSDEALRNLVAGHIATIQAFVMGTPGLTREGAGKLIETTRNAQRLLPENEKAIRSVNAMVAGNGYLALADLPAAEKAFKETLEDGVAGGNFYAAIYGPVNFILIAMIKGQLELALQLSEANIDRFNRLLAGQRFPPIGALYILKGCVLLEKNLLAEAEQALTQGLSLIRWTGEFRTHMKGYAALARLHSAQGDREGIAESLKFLEETRPESAPYAQTLRQRFSVYDPEEHKLNVEEAHISVTQAAARFSALPDITGIDLMSRIRFQTHLSDAYNLTKSVVGNQKAYSFLDVHKYFARQEKFANTHELHDWLIEIWLLRALMYHVEGNAEEARCLMQPTLEAAAPRGYFRIFLDEADLLRPLLESTLRHLKNNDLSAYVKRLLEAMPGKSIEVKSASVPEDILSDRELDVLRRLAAGESYKEIGQKLFLSLNTVQFHVKSIYRKLLVNKRMQAIEKAREMRLI